MAIVRRPAYLVSYLIVLCLLAGPVISEHATGKFWVPSLPFVVSYFLIAANALPLMVLLLFDPRASSSSAVYGLLPLMALQLWPLLYLAFRPSLPVARAPRFLFLTYSVGVILLVVALWLSIIATPSLG